MELRLVEEDGIRIVEGEPDAPFMAKVDDAGQLVEACLSQRAEGALLYADNLTSAFFDLSSGHAGAILQKLRNYRVRLAVVCPPGRRQVSSRFGEMVAEERRGRYFGLFETRPDARAWLGRRELLAMAAAVVTGAAGAIASTRQQESSFMYGLLGKMSAVPGQRDALVAILLEGTKENSMPGCLSYVVALDTADADAIWITEVWDSKASHDASLALPAVRNAIAKGKPLIAGFGERFETTPVGGHGLATARTRG